MLATPKLQALLVPAPAPDATAGAATGADGTPVAAEAGGDSAGSTPGVATLVAEEVLQLRGILADAEAALTAAQTPQPAAAVPSDDEVMPATQPATVAEVVARAAGVPPRGDAAPVAAAPADAQRALDARVQEEARRAADEALAQAREQKRTAEEGRAAQARQQAAQDAEMREPQPLAETAALLHALAAEPDPAQRQVLLDQALQARGAPLSGSAVLAPAVPE